MLINPRQRLKELSLNECLKLVLKAINNNDVLLFKSRLENLEKQKRSGLIVPENYNVEYNTLHSHWYEQVDDFSDEDIQKIIAHSYLKLDSTEFKTKLRTASFQLNEWKSDFESLPNSHIERPETHQIIQWVDAPLPFEEKGVILLSGDAGTGKSVIMRDVLRSLQVRGIPVLGIKADQYCVKNLEKLEKKLYLKEGIEAIVKALAQDNKRVVILIDQIDALSQSLSARREYLETFQHLVLQLLEIAEVRIVVSCRTYDLQNDHDFSFYRRQKKIEVGKLNDEQVKSILQRLSSEIPKLPLDLLELLRTPLHLDVFCQVYRSDLPFEKIKVLHDLYVELWFQKVLKINSSIGRKLMPENISALLFDVARTMYANQSLVITTNLFRQKYSSELVYLESTGILFKSREGITFFHQTFYDFTFAKQFIENGIPIEEYLLKSKQNLHIRSCLKMMMQFLRESNPVEYLRALKVILVSPNFYFHIKSLLLSLLGFVKNPTSEEMQFVRIFIFNNPVLFKFFISAVNSREWFLFLLQEKQLQRFVHLTTQSEADATKADQERFSNLTDQLNSILLRHLPESRDEVLTFLSDMPEVENKVWLVQNGLRNIGKWDNPLALKLFDLYSPKMLDVFFSDFLKSASIENLPWALNHLRLAIEKVIQAKHSQYGDLYFNHTLANLISHFVQNHPEATFDLLFSFQMRRLVLPEDPTGKTVSTQTKILDDFPLSSLDIDSDTHDSMGLFSLMIDGVRILAKNQSVYFNHFVSDNLESTSSTRLLILVEGFRANTYENVNEIIRFFEVFIQNQGVDTSEMLAWRVRQLLKDVYLHFSDSQKQHIIQLVSQVESVEEKDWALANKKPEWIGSARFKWMSCLPADDLAQIPTIQKLFLELAEQFQEMQDDDPSAIRSFVVGPPLEEDAYTNMTLDEWKNSFFTYDQTYEPGWASEKGGMEEHARQFQTEVKSRPGFFYPLIEELTSQEDLPKTYLIHGLDGLKEAKIEPGKLLSLLKKIDISLSDFDNWNIIRLVSLCGYFANEKMEDDFVIEFLVSMATTHIDPVDESLKVKVEGDKTESIYASGFNTVRGSAVYLLPYFYYFKKHEHLLFETLENVAEHDLLPVKSQMMPHLAWLTNLDKARALRLFLLMIRGNQEVVMKHSTWSAQYFARQNFEAMKTYFEQALIHPKLHKDMGIILSLAWISGEENAFDLLNQFVNTSQESKAGAIEVAARNIRNSEDQVVQKSIDLFERFWDEIDEKVVQAYDLAFRYLKSVDFLHLQPILTRFTSSAVVQKNPRPFYEYLIACATAYPKECLELIEKFDHYEKPDMRYAGYYNSEPLKVVVNAYNVLWGKKIQDHDTLEKALLIFDAMLLDDRFRSGAETVLENIER